MARTHDFEPNWLFADINDTARRYAAAEPVPPNTIYLTERAGVMLAALWRFSDFPSTIITASGVLRCKPLAGTTVTFRITHE